MGCHGPLIIVDRPGGSGRPLCSPARGRIRQERHQGPKRNPRWHSPSRPLRQRSYPMSQTCSLLPYKDRSRAPRGGPGASVLVGDFSCTYPQIALAGKGAFIFCYFSIRSDNIDVYAFSGISCCNIQMPIAAPPAFGAGSASQPGGLHEELALVKKYTGSPGITTPECSTVYAFRSLDLGRSSSDPHLRHRVARGAFRALHLIQILTLSRRASASGNLAISETPLVR